MPSLTDINDLIPTGAAYTLLMYAQGFRLKATIDYDDVVRAFSAESHIDFGQDKNIRGININPGYLLGHLLLPAIINHFNRQQENGISVLYYGHQNQEPYSYKEITFSGLKNASGQILELNERVAIHGGSVVARLTEKLYSEILLQHKQSPLIQNLCRQFRESSKPPA